MEKGSAIAQFFAGFFLLGAGEWAAGAIFLVAGCIWLGAGRLNRTADALED